MTIAVPPEEKADRLNRLLTVSLLRIAGVCLFVLGIETWIRLVGILFYVASMWVSGVMQGLMLNATSEGGTVLAYTSFLETLQAIRPMMLMRAIGGGLYLVGFLLMGYNLFRTIRSGKPVNETREIYVERTEVQDKMKWKEVFINDPLTFAFFGCLFMLAWFFLPAGADLAALLSGIILCWLGVRKFKKSSKSWAFWYERLLENYMPFTVLTLIAAAAGGLIQILPTITVSSAKNVEDRLQKIYTPLELAGRDIYVSEGCYNCHSQMIRTMVPDVLRYGDYSRLGESIYDHPFQWGSKRTGPDLARIGGKYPNIWHYNHMLDPRAVSPGSNMPSYSWLFENKTDIKALPSKIAAQRRLGVPYAAMSRDEIEQGAIEQGITIAADLKKAGAFALPDSEIVALIAYLQKIGQSEAPPEKAKEQPWNNQPFPVKPALPDKYRTANSTP